MEWEKVETGLQRARVPGGWLVKMYEDVVHFNARDHESMTSGYDWRISICFVPDEGRNWKL